MEELLQHIEQQQRTVKQYAAVLALPRRTRLAMESAVATGLVMPATKAMWRPRSAPSFEADQEVERTLIWGLEGVLADIAVSGYLPSLMLDTTTATLKSELVLSDMGSSNRAKLDVVVDIDPKRPGFVLRLKAEDDASEIDLTVHDVPLKEALAQLEEELEKYFWGHERI